MTCNYCWMCGYGFSSGKLIKLFGGILRIFRSLLAAVILTIGLCTATPAFAEVPPVEQESQQILQREAFRNDPQSLQEVTTVVDASGNFTTTLRASGATGYAVTCAGTQADNAVRYPHYSKGAEGAISKTVIKCVGTGLPSVDLRVSGIISFAPSNSATNTDVVFQHRGAATATQTVMVNGPEVTWYVPEPSHSTVPSNAGRGTGFWRATSTWFFEVGGKMSTVGTQTVTIWKTI